MDDCTFYGKSPSGEIIPIEYSIINKRDANTSNSRYCIFYSKEENANVKKGINTEFKLGKFPKGVSVGFVFQGPDERPQFTTPQLNISTTQNEYIAKDYNYIGKSITYIDNETYANASFTITKPISNGFIYHIMEGNDAVNVLGMENRTPGYKAYDGDYNDMLCLVKTNPIAIQPDQPILPPGTGTGYSMRKGYYLFEDNYPKQGDFDFNDVVIEYSIISYLGSTSKQVSATLLAKGCIFSNEFGFKDDTGYVSFFEGIKGNKNVQEISNEADCPSTTRTLKGDIIPYLNNGRGEGYIYDDAYNTDEYPYVLDIPISDSSIKFRWCLEGKSISTAYNFATPRASDWYNHPKDESSLIIR